MTLPFLYNIIGAYFANLLLMNPRKISPEPKSEKDEYWTG
jgi:hypothetical protein